MNNSPAPATKQSGQKLMLSAVLLALIGLAVWGMVSAGNSPTNAQKETPVTQKQDTLAEAQALLAAGRNEEAEVAFDQVINDPDSTSEQLRQAYEGKGCLKRDLLKFDEAIALFQKAAALIDKAKRPLLWAEMQFNAAELLSLSRKHKLSNPLFREIIRLRMQHQGARHPDLLPALEYLIYESEGKVAELADLPLYRQILEISEATLGPNHPDLIPKLDGLAQKLRSLNQVAEALPHLQRALRLTEQKPDVSEDELVHPLIALASALKETHQTEAAEPFARRYFEIREKELGAAHPSLASELIEFGELLKTNNRASEAESMFQRAYAIQSSNTLGDEGYSTHNNSRLGGILHEKGRLMEAEELYRKAIAMPSEFILNSKVEKASNLTHLSQILEETDRLPEAEPLLRESAGIYLANQSHKEDLNKEVLSGTANYLRAARELQVPEEEIHARMETEREKAKLDKAKFDKLWQEVLAKNPKDAVNALPTPPK